VGDHLPRLSHRLEIAVRLPDADRLAESHQRFLVPPQKREGDAFMMEAQPFPLLLLHLLPKDDRLVGAREGSGELPRGVRA